MTHKEVADDTGQGWRSAAGLVWAEHKGEIRPILPVGLPYQSGLTTPGREVAVLLRGGQGGIYNEKGVYTSYTIVMDYSKRFLKTG